LSWALVASAALTGSHRHAVWVMALAIEASVASSALALAGFRESRTRAAVAGWLACGLVGLLLALGA
jgi:hypothetical protein